MFPMVNASFHRWTPPPPILLCYFHERADTTRRTTIETDTRQGWHVCFGELRLLWIPRGNGTTSGSIRNLADSWRHGSCRFCAFAHISSQRLVVLLSDSFTLACSTQSRSAPHRPSKRWRSGNFVLLDCFLFPVPNWHRVLTFTLLALSDMVSFPVY